MITTTTATTPDASTTPAAIPDEAAVLAAVTAADNGTSTDGAKPAPTAPGANDGQPPAAGDGAKPGEKKPDEKPEDKKPDEKPESAYTKAKKDGERLDKSWKALDAEKAEFRAQKQQLETQIQNLTAEVAQLRTKPASPAGPAKDEHGIDAETYDGLAKKYEEEGDTRLAKLAREKAEELRKKPVAQQPAATAPAGDSWKNPEFQAKWNAEAAQIVKDEPDLANPEHPVFKAVNALVNNSPWAPLLRSQPNGIRAAVEVAKLQQAAAQVEPLRKDLDAAKAEIERLTKLVQPGGSPPGGPAPAAKKITDMAPDEAEAAVLAAARAADANGR
jgi:hypothetical protein